MDSVNRDKHTHISTRKVNEMGWLMTWGNQKETFPNLTEKQMKHHVQTKTKGMLPRPYWVEQDDILIYRQGPRDSHVLCHLYRLGDKE